MKCVGPSSVCTTMIDGKGAEHTICTQEIFERKFVQNLLYFGHITCSILTILTQASIITFVSCYYMYSYSLLKISCIYSGTSINGHLE